MFFKLFKLMVITLLISCSSPKYELYVEKFPYDISEKAINKCMEENSKVPRSACDIKSTVSSPITLLALKELLETVTSVLEEIKIPYFVDWGTRIGSLRFGSILPWDDDIDLGVFKTDFTAAKKSLLRDKLFEKGLEFKPHNDAISAISGLKGLYQISFNKGKFLHIIYKYDPYISSVDAENLWLKYDYNGRDFPHLDIFTWIEVEQGKYGYETPFFRKGQCQNRLLNINALLPTKQVDILGKRYPGIADFFSYSEICYRTRDIETDFVVYPDHKQGAYKIRFKNIKKHPEYLDFFDKYLRWVYKADYPGLSPALR